jgi:hypothetical protein
LSLGRKKHFHQLVLQKREVLMRAEIRLFFEKKKPSKGSVISNKKALDFSPDF